MAHIDAGKTTTTERFLFYSGYIHKLGQVDEGTAFMDFMAQEKERGITIMSAVTPVEWKNHIINIIDTPGHVDFTAEVQRSLRVLDGAVAVFCAVGGVQPQTETVWNQADSYNIPRIAYVNKMDRVGADFYKVVNDIQEKFNVVPLIIELPVGKEDKFEGVIDLITMKSLLFDSESFGAEIIETDIPDEYSKIAEEYRERMLETVCEANDELLEKCRKYYESVVELREHEEEILRNIEESSALPAEDIINAQKAVAKVTISRNKENTDALMNSNDELINQLFSIKEKIEANNNQIIEKQQALLKETNFDQSLKLLQKLQQWKLLL